MTFHTHTVSHVSIKRHAQLRNAVIDTDALLHLFHSHPLWLPACSHPFAQFSMNYTKPQRLIRMTAWLNREPYISNGDVQMIPKMGNGIYEFVIFTLLAAGRWRVANGNGDLSISTRRFSLKFIRRCVRWRFQWRQTWQKPTQPNWELSSEKWMRKFPVTGFTVNLRSQLNCSPHLIQM